MTQPSVRQVLGVLFGLLLIVGSVIGWRAAHLPKPAHVQIVLASDGALVVVGAPGRSLRARIQDPKVWDGQTQTSTFLAAWLLAAARADAAAGTFDGQVLVIVDDHASFQIAKMLVRTAAASYPKVSYVNGEVDMLPPTRRGVVEPAQPVENWIKDCSNPKDCLPK